MYYYEVWIGSPQFHSSKALTYSFDHQLRPGEIVEIPLRNKTAVGFIDNVVSTPTGMKIKAIVKTSGITLPPKSLALHRWLKDYYPAPSGSISNLFLPPQLPKAIKERLKAEAKTIKLPPLTKEQTQALHEIEQITKGSIMLHGDTGTGKTRLYMELAQEAIAQGKSVIVLTPEIGLTPQLEREFAATFSAQVVTLHSNLTPAQRRDRWFQIAQSTEPIIVIGPRSAAFSPLNNIGLIVVDEAHEHTYKQEQAPYYQTSRVAAQLARLHSCRCIFGTATPLVSDYYLFEQKKMPIIRLTQLAKGGITPPKIDIVSLKNRDGVQKSASLSNPLLQKIETALGHRQQVLLFLNRRGSARLILCQSCGWQALCPHCDIALTYHQDHNQLLCHTCGYKRPLVTSCPTCKSTEVLYNSPGTKSLAQEVKALFPSSSVQRFDSDNLADEKLERHFESLVDGKIDIIIGTQLVTKGLDLPRLGVVGIINADMNLNIPDYTAEEQTFQLLIQVIGRVGRHHNDTNVVIQTYNPDNPLFKLVAHKQWREFYQQQIEQRKVFGFPPFFHLLQLTITRSSQNSAITAGSKLSEQLRASKHYVVRGPSPRLHEKVRGKYHWHIIVGAKQRDKLLEVINDLPSGWQYNLDPVNLL